MSHHVPARVTATLSIFAVVAVVVAGCGQEFTLTGGTSGGEGGSGATSVTAGATSSTSGTTSSSTTSASSSSTGSGVMTGCNWSVTGTNPCGPGEYCDDKSCGQTPGAGTCKLKETPIVGDTPVCGCDGLTYWNESLASARGMSLRHNVACPSQSDISCTSTSQCPPGTDVYCRKVQASCDQAIQGTCWVLPSKCDATSEKVKSCFSQTCALACTVIRLGGTYDQTCN